MVRRRRQRRCYKAARVNHRRFERCYWPLLFRSPPSPHLPSEQRFSLRTTSAINTIYHYGTYSVFFFFFSSSKNTRFNYVDETPQRQLVTSVFFTLRSRVTVSRQLCRRGGGGGNEKLFSDEHLWLLFQDGARRTFRGRHRRRPRRIARHDIVGSSVVRCRCFCRCDGERTQSPGAPWLLRTYRGHFINTSP